MKSSEIPEEALRLAVSATLATMTIRGLGAAEISSWADRYLTKLRQNGAALELEELLAAGCKKLSLAMVLWTAVNFAKVPDKFYELMDAKDKLAQMTRDLEAAAQVFDWLALEPSMENFSAFAPSPTKMAKHLRDYQLLNVAIPTAYKAMNIRSPRDLERHIPTAYIREVTGEWHDRETSALIAAATGKDLDEGAHRAWRNRSFGTIELQPELIWHIAQIITEEHDKRVQFSSRLVT